jgi:hypothetical protein
VRNYSLENILGLAFGLGPDLDFMLRSGLRFLHGLLAHRRRDPCESATVESFVVQYSAHRLSKETSCAQGKEHREDR